VAEIGRQSVASQIYDFIKTQIRTGKLRQGAQLVESRLAKDLKVSRAPIREAVQRLSQEGLLDSRIGRSWTVRTLTPDDIRDLYHVRAQLEKLAVRRVIELDRAAAVLKLNKRIEHMHRMAATGNLNKLAEAELNFHLQLCELSRNKYVIDLYGIVAEHVRLSFAAINTAYANINQVAAEHVPIVERIAEGDIEGAQRLVELHIFNSLDEKIAAIQGAN
jgi:DNA-binding GntR family transcriptional regulator